MIEEAGQMRDERIPMLALFALVTLVAVLTVTPWPVGIFQDDAIYTILAKSLAEGTGFRLINMPGSPHNTHYPPGYPLLLAAMWKLWPSFPDNLVLFKFANAVFAGAAALGTYHFSRTRLEFGPAAAFVIACVSTLTISVLLVTGVVMSEPMFISLLIPALLFAERVGDSGSWRGAFLAGLLLGAVTMVRTIGAVAIPAAVLVYCWRRHWRAAAATAVGAALLLLPWQVWVHLWQHEVPHVFEGKYGSYSSWLVEGYRAGGWTFLRAVVAKNLGSMAIFGYITMPVVGIWPRLVTLVGFAAVAASGVAPLLRRASVTALFIAAYLAIVLIWPFESGRFLVAVWPTIVMLIALGVREWWRWRPVPLPLRVVRAAAVVLLAVMAAGFATYNYRGFAGRWWISVQRDVGTNGKVIAEWVAHNTAMSDMLVTEHDLIVYLYTGRQAVPTSTFPAQAHVDGMSTEQHKAAMREILSLYDPRFVLVGGPAVPAARELAADSVPALHFLGELSAAIVFEPAQ
jgi:hypothetical protein